MTLVRKGTKNARKTGVIQTRQTRSAICVPNIRPIIGQSGIMTHTTVTAEHTSSWLGWRGSELACIAIEIR